jgi:Zn-dependent protease
MSTPARADAAPGWRIGSLGGTPVYLGRSWPLLVLLMFGLVAPSLTSSGRSVGFAVAVAAASAVMLLVSVLVHEAAHALAARARGHGVDRIVADVWGGHTVYDTRGVTPMSTAVIAVVGPVSNLLLALVAWVLQSVVTSPLANGVLDAMTYTNLFVGLYNLLPGLPLDGGQIISSLVWRVTGRRGAGLLAAGWLGRVVAIGSVVWFVGVPLLRGERPTLLALVVTGMIAVFLWRGANASIRSGEIHDATSGPANDVLEPLVVVPSSTTLAQVEQGLATGAWSLGVGSESPGRTGPWVASADPSGWPVGIVDDDAARAVPSAAHSTTPISAVTMAQPSSWIVALPAGAVLTDLIRVMSERELGLAVVIDEQSRHVRGMATAERINDVVGAELARRSRR